MRWLKLFLMLLTFSSVAEEKKPFDHFTTGFPLDGLHEFTDCTSCHQAGKFRGTPKQCRFCHANQGSVEASTKNIEHIRSTDRCEYCHTTNGWNIVLRVDHNEVRGLCLNCHNNITARGKHPAHIPTTANCDACHSVNFWSPASFGKSFGPKR